MTLPAPFERRLPVQRLKPRRGPSIAARQAAIFYTVLVVVASLSPFVGWRDLGVDPFAYLRSDSPHFMLNSRFQRFDLAINLLGYLPLGLLASFAVYPRIRGASAVALATLYCAALSCGLEALQTYIPTRFASRIDLCANTAGGLLGALLAVWLAAPVLERGRLRSVYQRWFDADAGSGAVLIVLWFGAMTFPEPFALGIGGALKPLVDRIAGQPESSWLINWSTANFVAAEAAVCTFALAGATALLLSSLRPQAPARILVLAFLALTLVAKTLAQGIGVADDDGALGWITAGAAWGIGIAVPLVLVMTTLPRRRLPMVGLSALLLAIAMTNLAPDNPYYDAAEHAWASRRFVNFYSVSLALNYLWPFVALWYLLRRRAAAPAG